MSTSEDHSLIHQMSDADVQKVIKAAALLMAETALQMIEKDPHQYSSRPCETCRVISSLIGRPFGCMSAKTK